MGGRGERGQARRAGPGQARRRVPLLPLPAAQHPRRRRPAPTSYASDTSLNRFSAASLLPGFLSGWYCIASLRYAAAGQGAKARARRDGGCQSGVRRNGVAAGAGGLRHPQAVQRSISASRRRAAAHAPHPSSACSRPTCPWARPGSSSSRAPSSWSCRWGGCGQWRAQAVGVVAAAPPGTAAAAAACAPARASPARRFTSLLQ